MTKLQELKKDQKILANTIRKMKATRKVVQHGYVVGLEANREHYRHRHIAYCMLRGKEYKEIENKPREKADMERVNRIIEEFADAEDVCTGT